MRNRAQRWLSPPIFPDEEQTRVAGLLNLLLFALIVLTLLDAALLLVFAPETLPTFWINGVGVLGACTVLWIMRHGRVWLASVLLCASLWPLTAYYLATSGGLASPTIGFMSLFVAIGVTLFGARGAVGMGLLNVVFLTALYMAGTRGLLVSLEGPPTLSRLFATNSVALSMLTILLALSGYSIRSALHRARHGERQLAERNQALQHEINERILAQEALAKERKLLRTVIDHLPDNIFAKDREGEFVLNNAQSLRILGAPRQEDVLGKRDSDFFAHELAAKWHVEQQAIMQSGQPILDVEEQQAWRIDTRRWIMGSMIPLTDEHGEVIGLVGINRDITERKRAEEELRRRDTILEAVSAATDRLLKASDWQEEIRNVLGILGQAAQADRAVIFQIHRDAQGVVLVSARYEWDAPGISSMLDDPLLHNMKVNELGFGPLAEQFARKSPVYMQANNRPPGLRAIGESLGIRTSLYLPIALRDVLWGTIHLSVTREDFEWSKPEAEALQLAADMMGTVMERKQAEERLRMLSSAIEQSTNAVAIVDRAGTIEYANRTFLERNEFSPEEIVGKNWRAFLSKDSTLREKYAEIYHTVMERRAAWRGVVTDRARSGGIIWRDATLFPIKGAEGETSHTVYISEDITERKQAEEAYRVLVDYSLQGLIIVQDGRIVFANQTFAEMSGYTIEELLALLPEGVQAIIHPEDRAFVWERARRRLAGEPEPGRYEFRAIRKDGTERWVEQYASLIDYKGKPAAQTAYVDTTERKRAEDGLRQYAERLRTLHQIDQAMLMAASAEEIAQAAVQRIRQLIPCQHASVAVIDPETNELVLLATDTNGEPVESRGSRYPVDAQWVETVSQEQAYLITDLRLIPNPGLGYQKLLQRDWNSLARLPLVVHGIVLGNFELIADDPGVFTKDHLEIGREIADQLAIALENAQLYEQIQRHATELEQRVRERTEQLEAANRAKSAFLANMNHELRTPLNAILGFAHLLVHQGDLTGEQRKNLDIIERSGQHLLDLINDVLDMSRIEAGRVTVDESTFDLYETIREVEQLIALRASDKKLHLQVDIMPGVPRSVISDQRKLRQILINLLGNAVKFTETGSIVLRVQYTQAALVLDQPGSLSFEVEDTGPGIAEDEIGKLFQPFTQTESGRTMQQGTGLGLAITRQFVQLLGGDIRVKSRIGLGTTFTLAIPVRPSILPTTSKGISQRRAVGRAPTPINYRILIVDDAEENRLLLGKLLIPFGFEIREATNGKEGIELHETWHPHLIFMDMRMPVMDGYQAARRIKASTHGQATAIVALTASTFEETPALVLSAGCDDYIRKPVLIAELLAKIEQHLGVQFLYEEDETAISRVSGHFAEEPVLTQVDILELPRLWIRDLHALAVMADSTRMLRKIEEIQDEHPRLASALANLVKTFHLEALQALTSLPAERERS